MYSQQEAGKATLLPLTFQKQQVLRICPTAARNGAGLFGGDGLCAASVPPGWRGRGAAVCAWSLSAKWAGYSLSSHWRKLSGPQSPEGMGGWNITFLFRKLSYYESLIRFGACPRYIALVPGGVIYYVYLFLRAVRRMKSKGVWKKMYFVHVYLHLVL